MNFRDAIRILESRAAKNRAPLDPLEWNLVKARVAWVRETIAALAEAQERMDQRCLAAVNRVPEAEFERICDEEQAKVCVFLDQLNAVRDEDRWPAHLHFGEI